MTNQLCLVGAIQGSPGGYAITPDHASLHVGVIDVRIALALDNWLPTTGDAKFLVSKWNLNAPNQASWLLAINPDGSGKPNMTWSVTGTAGAGSFFTSNPAASVAQTLATIRMTFEPATGRVTFSSRRTSYDTAFDDCISDDDGWKPLGADLFFGPTSLFASNAPLVVSGVNGPTAGFLTGQVVAMVLKDGINGTVVACPDFSRLALGTTDFTDAAGRPWAIRGNDHPIPVGFEPSSSQHFSVATVCPAPVPPIFRGGPLRQKQRSSRQRSLRAGGHGTYW